MNQWVRVTPPPPPPFPCNATHLAPVAVKDGEEGLVRVPHEVAADQEAVLVGLGQGVGVVAWWVKWCAGE